MKPARSADNEKFPRRFIKRLGFLYGVKLLLRIAVSMQDLKHPDILRRSAASGQPTG